MIFFFAEIALLFRMFFVPNKDIFAVATDELHTASRAFFGIASEVVIMERQGSAIVASLPVAHIPIVAVIAVLDSVIYLPVDMNSPG